MPIANCRLKEKSPQTRACFKRQDGGNRSGQETQGAGVHHCDRAKVKKLSKVKDQRSQSKLPLSLSIPYALRKPKRRLLGVENAELRNEQHSCGFVNYCITLSVTQRERTAHATGADMWNLSTIFRLAAAQCRYFALPSA